ncbi:putative ribonuclease H-like domain-containing protein [Tanacetum coccineum]
MEDNHTIAQLLEAPTVGYEDAIFVPEITAYNFELKHGLLTLVQNKQFFRHDKEDPHAHIRYFNKITSTMKFPNVPSTSVELMLFPFSLEELHQLDTFYNALNSNDQDWLNSAAGGNFLDKMPRDCLRIIDSKSKVRNSRNKSVVAKVSSSSSTPGISPDVAELKDMVKALLLDKKSQAPAPVKAVKESCVTCGGAHSYRNCPATDGNVYRDNIQEYVSQAASANYNQGNIGYRASIANQIRPPGFPPVQNQGNNQNCYNQNQGNNYNQGQIYRPPINQPPVHQAPPYQDPAPQTQGVLPSSLRNTSAPMPYLKPSIPYPSRRNDERRREKANDQIEKFYEIFKDLSFEISLTDALILMPKFASTPKALIGNKEKKNRLDTIPEFPLILGRSFLKTGRALIDVYKGSLGFSNGSQWHIPLLIMNPIISTSSSTLTPFEDSDFLLLEEVNAFLALEDDPTSPKVDDSYYDLEGDILRPDSILNSDPSPPPPNQGNYLPEIRKELKVCEAKTDKSSIDESPEVELKDLPPHLEYVFLEGDNKLPVIIAKDLSVKEKAALIKAAMIVQFGNHKWYQKEPVRKKLCNYLIWEVIQNGNGPVSITIDSQGQIKVLPPRTAEEILARERERKARTTLLMALPEDHLAKFHKMTDAKEMWEAIKSRFGGNDESKKMQKYILKQQFEGFSVSNSEGLHKGYDRFQSLLSQLEIHGAGVSTEDANQKFLRSLPSAWSQVSLIMRTKPGVDSLSFDDLYNNLRVFENDVKVQLYHPSSTQNCAFYLLRNTISTNDVSTAYGVSNPSGHNSQYEQTSSYSLLANQSSCPQLDHEDWELLVMNLNLEEEMDLIWQVAMISMRMKSLQQSQDRHFARGVLEPREIKIIALVTIDGDGADWDQSLREEVDYALWLATAQARHRESDLENQPLYDRFVTAEGMHAIPPPMTGNYMPSGPEIEINYSQFTYGPKQTQTSESETQTSDFDTCESDCSVETRESLPEPAVNEPKVVNQPKVWSDAPIIEEYETDSEDEHVSVPIEEQETPSFANKQVKTPRETVKNQFTHSKNPRVDKKGLGYGFVTKACFVCGSLSHLIRDCDFHEKRMAKQAELNNRMISTARASGTNNVSTARHNFNSQAVLTNAAKKISTVKPFVNRVNTAEVNAVSAVVGKRETADYPHRTFQNKGIVDSGCSRHMTGNKAYLAEYQDFNGGPVAFGGSKGYITGKGKIKTGKLDFEDVCFVKELQHFNLFSVSQMCDKKNKVLFTDTECLVLSPEFKLPDENQVLLRIPRQNNMYSFNLENIVPSGGLACLIAKAIIDESNKWHRRLGHVNFKNLNKLVKGNLVRGLPSKIFQNDHTCVACQKGKQHKASCKAKSVRSISQPLQLLYMEFFGPTSVRSLNHKTYCLVITNDFIRFSWVFFLRTKDETSGIFKDFIRQIENQLNQKVKTIRCNNGTEFKNMDVIEFYGSKGIKREYSNARTPQQNGVAERKNGTLIEAVRTMLADSFLPNTFWAEAVSTACYVLNRVLVTKPQNKTPYELVTENKPNVEGKGPTWLFDLDYLTDSMNYQPVRSENQANKHAGPQEANQNAGTKENIDVGDSPVEAEISGAAKASSTNIVNTTSTPVSTTSTYDGLSFTDLTNTEQDDSEIPALDEIYANPTDGIFTNSSYDDEGAVADFTNLEPDCEYPKSAVQTRSKVNKSSGAHAFKISEALEDESWVDAMQQEEGIDYDEVFAPVARIEAIRIFLSFASYMGFIAIRIFLAFASYMRRCMCLNLQSGYRRGTIDKTLFIKKDQNDIMLVQVYVDDIIFGSTKRSWCDEFKALMKSRFQMSSMGELTFFLGLQVKQKEDGIFIGQDKYVAEILKKFDFASVKTASTLVETQKPLVKDEEAADVDVHLYRSMIVSLMYLIASRPDIMFAVCACSRFQVTSKTSHLNAMKRIFRYLKGKPKLGLWYPRVSSFDLEAYSDNDYAGANLDRKSTTGGCQFLGRRTYFMAMQEADNSKISSNLRRSQTCYQPHKAWLRVDRLKETAKRKKIWRIKKRVRSVSKQGGKLSILSKGAPSDAYHTLSGWSDTDLEDTLLLKLREGLDFQEDKGSAENGGSTKDTDLQQSIVKPDEGTDKQNRGTDRTKVSTDSFVEGTAEIKDQVSRESDTPTVPTMTSTPTLTIFGDGDTIAQVLVIMSQNKVKQKEKEKGVELKNVEDIERPRPTSTRSVLTLKPLPKIDPKAKGKGMIKEEDESDTESEDITEAEKKLAKEEATKAAFTNEYDFIQARLNADKILAEKLQEGEREKFTIEERAKLLHDTIAAQRRFLAQQKI